MERVCKKCTKEKDISMFPKDKYSRGGFSLYCKQCKSIYHAKRLQKNKDSINTRRRLNRHKYAERELEYRLNNKESIATTSYLHTLSKKGVNKIYSITFKDSNYFYIGCTHYTLTKRLCQHISASKSSNNNLYSNMRSYIDTYGKDGIEINEITTSISRKLALELEATIIQELSSSNPARCLNTAHSGDRGVVPSL